MSICENLDPGVGAGAQRVECDPSQRPLCIDLFCGLGGWAEGFLAEGYDVIGFDIEARPYPGWLALQDVRTLHGSQFKHAACIVASPPCTEYSYMAMPWSRAKQIAGALCEEVPFPEGYTGSRTLTELNALFDACFRIQREASEAAGRYIPLIVENVKGAQPWVGRARANFGSFYLWGDVDSIGGRIVRRSDLRFGAAAIQAQRRGLKLPGNNTPRMWADREVQRLCDALKVPGINWNGHGKPGYKPKGFNVTAAQRYREENGGKQMSSLRGFSHPGSNGKNKSDLGGPNDPRRFSSKSDSRKAASAQIAKIPFPLAQHIARIYKPAQYPGTVLNREI